MSSAVTMQQPAVLALVKQLQEDRTHEQVTNAAMAVDKFIATKGGDPNQQSAQDGETPLMAACWVGADMVASTLMGHGADASLRARNGASALSVAVYRHEVAAVRLLLHHGGEGVKQLALQHGLQQLLDIACIGLEVMSAAWFAKSMEGADGCSADHARHRQLLRLRHRCELACKVLTTWFRQQMPKVG